MLTPKSIVTCLALIVLASGNAWSANDSLGFSIDRALLESSIDSAAFQDVLPVAYQQESTLVPTAPAISDDVAEFHIESLNQGSRSWWQPQHWRFGARFVSLDRHDSIRFSPNGLKATSGRNYGVVLAGRLHDQPRELRSDAWEAILRYVAGESENHDSSNSDTAIGKASMLDCQLNRRLSIENHTRSGALITGLRVLDLDDEIDLMFDTSFHAESRNLLVGGQVGFDGRWQPNRFALGGGMMVGLYGQVGESATSEDAFYSDNDLAFTFGLDLNTTYQFSDVTQLVIGYELFAIGGVQTSRDVISFESDDSDAIAYSGFYVGLSRSTW